MRAINLPKTNVILFFSLLSKGVSNKGGGFIGGHHERSFQEIEVNWVLATAPFITKNVFLFFILEIKIRCNSINCFYDNLDKK